MGRGYDMTVQVVQTLPMYYNFDSCKIGSFALTVGRTRYVPIENAIMYNQTVETVGYHYRKFIESLDTDFPKKGAPDYPVTYPYFAHAGYLPNAVYIDLRNAFLQIANAVGYEVWFKEGKAIGYGDNVPSHPLFSEVKTARGLLVTGHGKQGSYTLWQKGELSTVHFRNENYAPFLRYAIWRILHSIMGKVKPYCYYVHTDGAIINTHFLSKVERILSEMGLSYSVKLAGSAHIKGVGNFKLGEYETGTYRLRERPQSKDYILSDEYDNWWLEVLKDGREFHS